MSNNADLYKSLEEIATAAGQAELDRQLDYLNQGLDDIRRQQERERKNLPLEFCEGANGEILTQFTNKDSCAQGGGLWTDRRNVREKLKDKWEKSRDALPNYLDRATDKMKKAAASVVESSNPRNKTARKTGYINIDYGSFREACVNGDESIVFKNYSPSLNILRLPNKLWGGKRYTRSLESVTYTEDANMFLGPTKVSIQRAITSDMPNPDNPKDQIAAFTMAIKKMTWENTDPNDKSVGDLTVEFYTMPGSQSVFPNNDFSAYIPLELTNSSFDDQTIQFGRYVFTGAASVDFMSSFHQAWRFDTVNRLQADGINLTAKIIDVANEEILSREFFCCIFFEIIAASPELKEVLGEDPGLDPTDLGKLKIKAIEKKIKKIKKDEEWDSDPNKVAKVNSYEQKIAYYEEHGYSVEDFLNQQKEWMLKLKNILEIIAGLLTGQGFQFGFPAFAFNILEILINSVYAVLMIVLEEIQAHVLQECYAWVAEQRKEKEERVEEILEHEGVCVDGEQYTSRTTCQEAGFIWEPGATWETAAINCLPWEQILIVVIDSLFGNDGLFKHVKGFIERVKNDMLLKTQQLESDSYDINEQLENSKYLKYILQALDILDWLLDLNVDALQLCNMYNRNLSMLGPDHYQQAVEDSLTGSPNMGGQTLNTGVDQDDLIGNPNILQGNVPGAGGNLSAGGRVPSDYQSSSKIDITGNIVNPLGLLLYQNNDDIKKFFTQYMGLTPAEAEEAVTGEKRGQCMKKLSESEAQQLKQILNNTRMEE
tara:strand:- start:1677 stop:3983 length:2307 start_codon:yes stop_codon:yes gene_type:complete